MALTKTKVGVITFLETRNNYGQVLQAFALQYVLKQWGYDAFVIDYEKIKGKNKCKKFILSLIEYLGFSDVYWSFRDRKLWQKDTKRKFDDFKKKYISCTEKKYRTLYQLQKTPPDAQYYITGSDQVWAQLISDQDNRAYFLDFGNDDIQRISYAPSFVMSEYPSELLSQLGHLLKRFDHISVRENCGIEICNAVGCKDVKKVADPTLLLTGDVYKRLFLRKKIISPYIFIYCLNIVDKEEMEWSAINAYAKNKYLNIIVTPSSGVYPAKELFEGVSYSYCTVEGWISNIAYSSLVVTTSFHGIVFSLLLNRNFVYVPLKNAFKRANDRVYELLEILDLKDKIVTNTNTFNRAVLAKIDWCIVNEKLDKYRKTSLSFLKESLNK